MSLYSENQNSSFAYETKKVRVFWKVCKLEKDNRRLKSLRMFMKVVSIIKKPLVQAVLVFLVFFTAGILTLNSYGISWDEPLHLIRGQAYLHYFLTGETNYDSLPEYDLQKVWEGEDSHQRSFYQQDSLNMEVWLGFDDGHPPLNGILAAFFNYVFYQKLGIVGDVESFHIFNIFISSVLVATVFLFALETFGLWVALFSALFLATYPLFWGESHFNIKDPAETSLFFLTTYFFWKAFHYKKSRFIFISSIFAGLALSVKFNILFLPFILGPWLVLVLIKQRKEVLSFIFTKATLLSLFMYPVVMFVILFSIWPYLWQDTFKHLGLVFKWYRNFGIQGQLDVTAIESWKSYALSWVVYASQPLMLVFVVLGLLSLKKNWSSKSCAAILWLILFVFPILRVSLPGTNIYGGVRQIMEFLPGMALIAGLGTILIYERFKSLVPKLIIFVLMIGILIYPLIKLHPYENVYFNSFIGGLPGATKLKFPSAGSTLGNAYKAGTEWINNNLESGANIGLVQNTILNLPPFKIRPDIHFNNSYWSGIKREGEYLMELTYNYENRVYFYAWEYAEKMLEPVHQVKIEGVPILTIWKNDLEHTKLAYRKKETRYSGETQVKTNADSMTISFPQELLLSKVVVYYPLSSCTQFKTGYIETSLNRNDWIKEKDLPSLNQLETSEDRSGETFFKFMFAARSAKYIRLYYDDNSSCIITSDRQEIFTLE